MLLGSALVATSALPALISGIQIPMANGVIGGAQAPSPNDCNFKTTKGGFSNDAQTKTAGELRVVENSGVCGRVTLFYDPSSCHVNNLCRNDPGCLSGFWIW
jgi:hypothetical protein